MDMNVMTFDIETVPDVATGRRLYDVEDLDEADVAEIMFTKRREQTGESEFLPHYLHRIVAISVAFRSADRFRIWSLGDAESGEKELISRFFEGVEKFTPVLVSWNGGGFDLPVLHYRALINRVSASRYWENGDEDREFRFNNYLSRFHYRHIDLMDVLAGYQFRASAPLDGVALSLGFPGKLGQSGAEVWNQYRDGNIVGIRNYCETDVLNTYLVYLTFELTRGRLTERQYRDEIKLVRTVLAESGQAHLEEFLDAWPAD